MKKNFLLLTVMLFSGLCVNAIDWQEIETQFPNVSLYVDADSIRKVNDDECLYAMKYSVDETPEKVAYIKSNAKTGYSGIIYTSDYEVDKYKPNAVFANPHVFMKPVNDTSFLKNANTYALSCYKRCPYYAYSNRPELRGEIPVAYKARNPKDIFTPEQLQGYVARTCETLEANWFPPATGHSTRAVVVLTIGADGSLLDYKFTETSGDNVTDKSILAAAEKAVPYPRFPEIAKGVYSMDFQFVFEHDLVRKSVVY